MNKQQALEALYNQYIPHKTCPLKKNTPHQLIFGSGPLNAKIMIIGEAPGKTEEERGKPFVGKSGELLIKTLNQLNMQREDIFITNVVKCRPHNNKTPTKKEVNAYIQILLSQIEIIKPMVICTLGSVALKALVPHSAPITTARSVPHSLHNIIILPTYHPAYILRNKNKQNDFYLDIKKAISIAK